jgi:hypothetical protein
VPFLAQITQAVINDCLYAYALSIIIPPFTKLSSIQAIFMIFYQNLAQKPANFYEESQSKQRKTQKITKIRQKALFFPQNTQNPQKFQKKRN